MIKPTCALFLLFCVYSTFASDIKQLDIYTEHLPPFQIQKNQQVTGFATDIIKEIMLLANLDYQIKIYPWTRSFNMAKTKENACIYSIGRTSARENLFHWIGVIATTHTSFVSLKSRQDINVNSIDDAKKYRVAVLRDDATHKMLLDAGFIENHNLFVVNNTHSLLKLLTQRQSIDLIMADPLTVKHRAIYDKLDPSSFIAQHNINEQPMDFYLACNISTPDTIVESLKRAVERLKSTGRFNAIIEEWGVNL